MTVGAPLLYPVSDMIAAMQQTRTIEDCARVLGCSSTLIQIRAREDGALQQAIRDQAREREKEIAVALLRCQGSIRKAAVELHMDASVIRFHVQRSPRLREIYLEAREGLVDTAEDNVFAAVERGNLGYSWRILQTLGKNRGYTERRELEAVHVHVKASPTSRLVELLDQHAQTDPQLVEQELEKLGEQDRALLMNALKRHAPDEVDGELVAVETADV